MTKREACARALVRAELSRPEFYGASGKGLEKAIDEEWRDWLSHTDAIFAELAKPDEAMDVATAQAMCKSRGAEVCSADINGNCLHCNEGGMRFIIMARAGRQAMIRTAAGGGDG